MTLLILFITIFTLYGFAFALAGMLLYFKEVGGLVEVIGLILPILCGSLFPISILPNSLQAIAKLIPLTYYFDMIRYYALNTKTILDPTNQIYLILVFSIIIPIIGFKLFLFAERTARKRGNFGTY